MSIEDNYKKVADSVEASCKAQGRDPNEVVLLAVSKTTDLDGVRAAMSAGARDFGENRPDELVRKYEAFPDVRWHFIGNIQSRRIKDIVKCSYLIHSLYEPHHAERISREAEKIGKVQDVLLEVNVSGEYSKGGLAPVDVALMIAACSDLPNIRVRGLMTMAPQGDLEAASKCFEGLSDLLEKSKAGSDSERLQGKDATCALDQLSMGMSEDFHEAIGAGSTIVRIGRAIFSDEFDQCA